MEVPFNQLQPETLQALIEEFVTRDAADYNYENVSLEEKSLRVRAWLECGKAAIVFDNETGTCNIIPK